MIDDPDVLVVDDIQGVAEDVARLISTETGLKVSHASSAAAALDLARLSEIKVVVLDQRMPTPGTVLFKLIAELVPDVYAIMLTGEASLEEVGDAMSLGFRRYVPRGEVTTQLSAAVLHGFTLVERERSNEVVLTSSRIIARRRWPRFKLSRAEVTYWVSRIALLDEHYTPESEWQTEVELLAGQRDTVETSEMQEIAVVLESETTQRLTTELSANAKQIAALKAGLKSEVAERFKDSLSSRIEVGSKRQREYELAAPSDPSGRHVALRRIQYGPEYLRLRVRITIECSCCSTSNIAVFESLCRTGKTAVRQEDRFSDGSVSVDHLGSG